MLIINKTDQEQFNLKDKSVIYTRAIDKLYNGKNRKQVNEINGMIELEKIYASTKENAYNLNTHQMIEI